MESKDGRIDDGSAFEGLGGDTAEFRFAELPVKRRAADAVVKALLLGDSQDGMPDGPNTLMV
ncbi:MULTISPECIES: hypothetical protein [unclassified Burkholderia]|uniref:hypothetical protein n=1 Tax=unclassified Burkholderia TaxID=2613784 RepID=UPI001D1118C2|nr:MULTISPECIES: hypothetical protein [unclassified Burkholderia]